MLSVLLLCLALPHAIADPLQVRRLNADIEQQAANKGWTQQDYQYFDQRVDHTSNSSQKTFRQRWTVDESHYQPGGPLLISTPGEGELSPYWLGHGPQSSAVQKMGGLLVALEHRYYGASFPVNDTSVTENLRYLSLDQALLDSVAFVRYIRSLYEMQDSKTIVFGCSYAGMISSNLVMRYPDVFDVAISGCAPLQATEDFTGYGQRAYDAYVKFGGQTCADNLVKGISDLASTMLNGTAAAKQSLLKQFGVCSSFMGRDLSDTELGNLFNAGFLPVAGDAQYETNNSWPTYECNAVAADPLAGIANLRYNPSSCLDLSEAVTSSFASDRWRSWWYQKCTEFGYFKTTSSGPFTMPKLDVEYFRGICKEAFGTSLIPDVAGTNNATGGRKPDPATVSNVMYIKDTYGPWSILSTPDDSTDYHQTLYEHAGHCEYAYGADADSPSAVAAFTAAVDFAVEHGR